MQERTAFITANDDSYSIIYFLDIASETELFRWK